MALSTSPTPRTLFFLLYLLLALPALSSPLSPSPPPPPKPFPLRLMPLGASITEGVGSSTGLGYRKPLRDQLRAAGWAVNAVGSKRNGNASLMLDRDNEGHPGWIISQVADLLPEIAWMRPNLVTLNVGTNDCVRDIDIPRAADRLAGVVDALLADIPGVTVLVSTLLPNTVSEKAGDNVDVVNRGIRDLVAERAGQKKRVLLAEMNDGEFIPASMLVDGTHPGDDGHARMAAVWWDAVRRAESAGLLREADPHAMNDTDPRVTFCDDVVLSDEPVETKLGGGGGGGGGSNSGDDDVIFFCDMRGTGRDDHVWISPDGRGHLFGNSMSSSSSSSSSWSDLGEIFNVGRDRAALYLADWDGDGRCDVLSVSRPSSANISVEMWRNGYDAASGRFSFAPLGTVHGSASCNQTSDESRSVADRAVRIADVDGDGRADLLCMEPSSRTTGWLNPGPGPEDMQDVGQVKLSVGRARTGLRFVDVTGDGRADLVWVDGASGDARVWINRGKVPASGSSFTWDDRGVLFSGKGRYAGGEIVHLANLAGLGRGDYVTVEPGENTAKAWFNECDGPAVGDDPESWLPLPEYPPSA